MKTLRWVFGILFILSIMRVASVMEGTRHAQTPEIASSACKTSDIAIDKLRARTESTGYTRVTGRLTNNCAQAVGAEIKITVYDKTGNILRVDDIWPASWQLTE